MTEREILVPTAVMSLLRREDSVRGVAARFGVTEAEVLEWLDVFVVAGVLALTELRTSRMRAAEAPKRASMTNYYSTHPPHSYSEDKCAEKASLAEFYSTHPPHPHREAE